MSEKHETYVENDVVAEKRPRSDVKRHCARFWWLHLVIFCVVFLIIALCLVYVAMPKIAQQDVNKSSLSFNELNFMSPTSDSVTLTQVGVLHNPSTFTPTLDSFNASVYLVTNGTYGSTSFMSILMPKIHARHGNNNVSVENQVVTVQDLDQLSDYCIAVLSQENVTTALVGKTKLHLGALPSANVNYNEATTYKALNGLAGFNVTSPKINLTAGDAPNFTGLTFIPNPSDMTIAMGNVTLSLSTNTSGVIGNATIENMTIVPGNNSLPMTAYINQTSVLASLDANGDVTMQITGTSAVYNGQHLEYYERALAANVLELKMNIAAVLAEST